MKYIKQMVVDAMQFTGDNQQDIINFCEGSAFLLKKNGKLVIKTRYDVIPINEGDYILINEGNKSISKLSKSNFHKMCKPLEEGV